VTIGFLIFVGLVTDQNDDARVGFAYLGGCVSDAGPCRAAPSVVAGVWSMSRSCAAGQTCG
jgi:hypothetical protein